jgi:uncharacterized protein YkwD
MLQTPFILIVQLLLSAFTAHTQAAPITLRESALIRRQARLELNAQVPTEKQLSPTPINRRAQRLQLVLQRQKISNTTGLELLLTSINQERTKNNLPILITNSNLEQISHKRIGLSNRESSRQTLQTDLDAISLFDRKDECNCLGTNNEFRFLSFTVANETTGFTRLIKRYEDVFLNTTYQYIGIAQSGTKFNVLLGGYAKIPVTEFSDPQIIEYRAKILELVNTQRSIYNLAPLTENADLQTTAQKYAERMWNEGFYGHISPKGDSVEERLNETNYFEVDSVHCNCHSISFAVGENIAKGQKNPEEVMDDWMNSPGHRENILSKDFKEIGIGLYGNRWVQNFGAIIYE